MSERQEQPKLPENVIPEVGGELFIFARNPAEMTVAQQAQITWAESRIELKKKERNELQENLTIATTNKWRTSGLKAAVHRAQKKVEFYEKVRDALKAGYYIIPDMMMDVFAIRTTRKRPLEHRTSGPTSYGGPRVRDEQTNTPPSGQGDYVSPQQLLLSESWQEAPSKEGEKPKAMVTRWASEHGDVDFPFTFAKPDVLVATSEAIQKKIFDEIGVVPRRTGSDPMVIGRVTYKAGYFRKNIAFLVAWFIDTKEL